MQRAAARFLKAAVSTAVCATRALPCNTSGLRPGLMNSSAKSYWVWSRERRGARASCHLVSGQYQIPARGSAQTPVRDALARIQAENGELSTDCARREKPPTFREL